MQLLRKQRKQLTSLVKSINDDDYVLSMAAKSQSKSKQLGITSPSPFIASLLLQSTPHSHFFNQVVGGNLLNGANPPHRGTRMGRQDHGHDKL